MTGRISKQSVEVLSLEAPSVATLDLVYDHILLGSGIIDFSFFVESCTNLGVRINVIGGSSTSYVNAGGFITGTAQLPVGGWTETNDIIQFELEDPAATAVIRTVKLELHHGYAPRDLSIDSDYPKSVIGNDLTVVGPRDFSYKSISAGALAFTSTEKVTVGTAAWDNDGTLPMTISFWFKSNNTGTQRAILGNASSPAVGYTVLWMSDGRIALYMRDTTTTTSMSVPTESSWADNLWHYAIITYDGSKTAAGVTITIDGIQQETTNPAGFFTGVISDGTQLSEIARATSNANFIGSLMDVKININGNEWRYPFSENKGNLVYDVINGGSYSIVNYSTSNRVTQDKFDYNALYGYSKARVINEDFTGSKSTDAYGDLPAGWVRFTSAITNAVANATMSGGIYRLNLNEGTGTSPWFGISRTDLSSGRRYNARIKLRVIQASADYFIGFYDGTNLYFIDNENYTNIGGNWISNNYYFTAGATTSFIIVNHVPTDFIVEVDYIHISEENQWVPALQDQSADAAGRTIEYPGSIQLGNGLLRRLSTYNSVFNKGEPISGLTNNTNGLSYGIGNTTGNVQTILTDCDSIIEE